MNPKGRIYKLNMYFSMFYNIKMSSEIKLSEIMFQLKRIYKQCTLSVVYHLSMYVVYYQDACCEFMISNLISEPK